ncbi:MAG: hypothetical protein DRG78_15330 [Epsilonproteobacteria bacterium]|nr:MAG: hypothetical protein DRG78_15330 [Campylobacterota bacterium]
MGYYNRIRFINKIFDLIKANQFVKDLSSKDFDRYVSIKKYKSSNIPLINKMNNLLLDELGLDNISFVFIHRESTNEQVSEKYIVLEEQSEIVLNQIILALS